MGEPELAKTDFEAVLKLEPGNKAAANSIIMCNIKIKEQKGKEKKIYANMFEKFAQRDKEVGRLLFVLVNYNIINLLCKIKFSFLF